MKSKKGVTMMMLIIIIIVLLILTSVITIEVSDNIESARVANFTDNISTIQEYIDSKVVLNEQIPILNEKSFTIDELKSNGYILEKNIIEFKNEVINNGEDENTTFNIIDVNNVNDVGVQTIGNGKKGTDDYFAFSTINNKVYYLYGIKTSNGRYFSINNNISNVSQIKNQGNSSSKVSVETYSGIKITKNYTGYTNKMGINIQANLEDNENIFITIGNQENKKQFKKTSNKLNITFNNINELNSYLTSSIESLFEDRYMIVTKENESGIISSYKIELSNYDIDAPLIINLGSTAYDTMKILSGECNDLSGKVNSGVNCVKYGFLLKTDGTPYYKDNVDFNLDYMIKKAKTVRCDESGKFSIKVPTDVAKVRIICIDNAGNTSNILDFSL